MMSGKTRGKRIGPEMGMFTKTEESLQQANNNSARNVIVKRGVAGGRFGDHLCLDCANLPYVGIKFTRPRTQIYKSTTYRPLMFATLGMAANIRTVAVK